MSDDAYIQSFASLPRATYWLVYAAQDWSAYGKCRGYTGSVPVIGVAVVGTTPEDKHPVMEFVVLWDGHPNLMSAVADYVKTWRIEFENM